MDKIEKGGTSRLPKGALKLMVTAERLFGEHGLEGVSLRQIVSAAGQANSSAVQHHFGSKKGLIQAVYDMRLPELEHGRAQRLIAAKDQTGHIALPQLLHTMFAPVYEDMNEETKRHFGLFNLRLMQLDTQNHPYSHTKVTQPAYAEIQQRLEQHFTYLPVEVFQLRMRLTTKVFLGALSESQHLEQLDNNPYPSMAAYWNEILQVIEALLRVAYTTKPSHGSNIK